MTGDRPSAMLRCVELIFILAVVLSVAAVAPLALPALGIATEAVRTRGVDGDAGAAEVPSSGGDAELSVQRRLYGERRHPAPLGKRPGPALVRSGALIEDRYRLLEGVGAGGMARVYRAHDELLERDVAVKLIAERFAADPPYVERFRREARLCARLSHSNILAVLDAGDEPREYIVMEFVEGLDARKLLKRRGRLTPGQTVHIVAQICDALTYAHNQGVVHCDVSPSNILLRRSDGAAKLADFGLAFRAGEVGSTQAGGMSGTPGYVAPEVLWGAEPTPRSDLYCLGAVAYGFLVGPTRLRHDDVGATAPMATAALPMPPLAEFRADLPRCLVAAVAQAVALEPDSRQDSVAEFRAQLIGKQRELSRAPRAGATFPGSARAELPRAA